MKGTESLRDVRQECDGSSTCPAVKHIHGCFSEKPTRSLSAALESETQLPSPVYWTSQRLLAEMRHYGIQPSSPDDSPYTLGRTGALDVARAYGLLHRTLHAVDSMLSAGASPGTIHAIIEQALAVPADEDEAWDKRERER